MKISASHALPFVVEDTLISLGERISIARRALAITQPDLAAKAGVGLTTVLNVEKGAPTVQIGSVFKILWALGLEGTFEVIGDLGRSKELESLMTESLPLRVRSKGARRK